MEFNKLIRLLIPCTIQGVLKAPKLSRERVVDRLEKIQFVTRNISHSEEESVIKLQILDETNLFILLAGEAHNFLLASRLTYDRAIQHQPNNAAWQAVEHYYSAYYAVHYLIRTTGITLTNIDQAAERYILRGQLEDMENKSTKIQNGLYILKYDESQKILTLTKNNKRGSGGSHQDAWKLWLELLDKLNVNSNADPVEYAGTSMALNAHKSFLLKSTGRYNPPELRAEINYQFKGGAWAFEKDSVSLRHTQNAIANATYLVDEVKPNIRSLIANNNVIINLAKQLFLESSRSYPKSICCSLANQYEVYLR